MAFKLKSGNTSSFKKMGSSAAKQRRTGKFVVKDGKKVYQENEKGDDGYGGEGFMQPPYRYPAGPTEKRKGYHGYKPKEINFNKKVMVDGETNEFNKAKIKANKETFDKLSQADKDKLQKAANEKRAKFEASDEYKKRKKNSSSPAGFVSAAQRKAVWASKNEKK